MSKVISWSYNPAGTLTVKFDDHSEIMSQAEAIKAGIIKDPGVIKSTGSTNKVTTGASTTGNYSASAGTPFSDPTTGQTSNTNFAVPVNGQMVQIGTLLQEANKPKVLANIRQSLVQNGIISKGTKSANSVIQAYTSVLVKAAATSMNPNDWMAQYKSSGGGLDVQSTGPQTNISTRTYTPDSIRNVAEQIYINKLGMVPSEADLKQLVDQLNAKEKKQPTVTTTVPKGAGNVTQTTTTGGVDEAGVITQMAMARPEYQREQNINFASWLDKAMTKGQPSIGSLTNG